MGMEQIEHLVLVMMENRSFDHYLGALNLPPENRTDNRTCQHASRGNKRLVA